MDTDVSEDLKIDLDEGYYIKNCRVLRKQTFQPKAVCPKEERNASIKKVASILQKSKHDRTIEESQMLAKCSQEVEEVQSRWRKRDEAKRRLEEIEEPLEQLQEKCQFLAQAIAQSQHLVVYTGAGISTAARIPDYRGTNGIWTRLQQGKDIGNHDLSLAEPTYTHMALAELYRRNILKYVVSQNCDGLHLRSGLPRIALSELHGNMFIEVCKNCKPVKEYLRQFDVTENTARYSHKTMRRCYVCNHPLVDTIVHFGERGNLQWPLNWTGACKNAKNATTILCLGSSLKVLKKYPWLWQMDKPAKRRPNLYIVNLQWTPKDDCANVKIHGKCDEVMGKVMDILGIAVSPYVREKDPIFVHATPLCNDEMHTTTQPFLKCLDLKLEDEQKCEIKVEGEDESKTHQETIISAEERDCKMHLEDKKHVEHSMLVDKEMHVDNEMKMDDKINIDNNVHMSIKAHMNGKLQMDFSMQDYRGTGQESKVLENRNHEQGKMQEGNRTHEKSRIHDVSSLDNQRRVREYSEMHQKSRLHEQKGLYQTSGMLENRMHENRLHSNRMHENRLHSNRMHERRHLKGRVHENRLSKDVRLYEDSRFHEENNRLNGESSLDDSSTCQTVQTKKDCVIDSSDSDSMDTVCSTMEDSEQSKLFNCDTSSNSRVPSPPACSLDEPSIDKVYLAKNSFSLPINNIVNTSPPKPNAVHTKFLIEDILENKSDICKETPVDNIFNNISFEQNRSIVQSNIMFNQAFLTYYQISNALFQSQMLKQDIVYYPFQTSFLYPGLHSIINPMPYLTEDYNYSNRAVNLLNNSQLIKNEPIVEKVEPTCTYCHENYKTVTCYFYPPMEPKFSKHQYRLSKIENKSKPVYCVCCDYSTDEEDMEPENNVKSEDNEKSSDSKIFKLDEGSGLLDKEQMRNKIQAGWFGKGYKKNRRNKKR